MSAVALGQLEEFLYGTAGTDPSLPTPDAVVALFSGSVTQVTPTEPSFNGTDTITIPVVAGVKYFDGAIEVPSGAYVITEDTVISARPEPGYVFPPVVDTDWLYVFA